jgi:3-oxoacyl-[acyl-carrier protein] reductase
MARVTLDGRRVVVTGGSRGIGRAIVLACAREGAAVAFTYVSNAAAAEETLVAARALGATCAGFQSDVADAAAVTRAYQDAKTALGGAPDVLVNNAAVTHDAMLMLTNDAAWDRVLATNLKGAFLCSKAALRGMIAGKWGRIVNVVSPAAFLGKEGAAAYAASKGGLVAMTKTLAREVARYGITVNAVSPGLVETELIAGMAPAQREAAESRIPLGRLATADEVAAAVVYLISPAAAYVTGTTLHVDGGLTML